MNKVSPILLGILGIVVVAGLWLWGTYNGLVGGKENVRTAWAQIETQYQRRMDLIPNLVNTVKGSANFEQSTLQAVVEARSAWANAKASGDVEAQVRATNAFDSALSRLLVTVEAYPDLKSTQAFRDLMTELEGTENRISVARKDYNEVVRSYNLKTKQFPSNIVAGIFNFEPAVFFEADSGAEKAPSVEFDFNSEKK